MLNAQKWIPLENTDIEKISIKNDWHFVTYFKKDSGVISVPEKLQSEFTQLFSDNRGAFDSIYQTCSGFSPIMIGDTLQNYFEKSNVKYIIYFTKRIVKKEGNSIIWNMTNVYGQGQPCWPVIYVKRIITKNVVKLLFVSIDRGMCEI
jgi:hypothetical protein